MAVSAWSEQQQCHDGQQLNGDLDRKEPEQWSREHTRLTLGLSTRGALSLLKAARITAGLRGSEFVAPDDVKEAATWVIAHRLVLTPEAALEGLTDVEVVRALLADTVVPR